MENIFDTFFETADTNADYVAAGYCADIAKNIENIMEAKGINNTQLAEKLNCKKPYITKILSGEANLTLHSLAKISVALDSRFEIALKPTTFSEDRKLKVAVSQNKLHESLQNMKLWIAHTRRSERHAVKCTGIRVEGFNFDKSVSAGRRAASKMHTYHSRSKITIHSI